VLELRFSPHLPFSLAACSLFFALAIALALASLSLLLYLFLPPCVPHSLTPLPLPLPPSLSPAVPSAPMWHAQLSEHFC
jgi:hypothetical protein